MKAVLAKSKSNNLQNETAFIILFIVGYTIYLMTIAYMFVPIQKFKKGNNDKKRLKSDGNKKIKNTHGLI